MKRVFFTRFVYLFVFCAGRLTPDNPELQVSINVNLTDHDKRIARGP